MPLQVTNVQLIVMLNVCMLGLTNSKWIHSNSIYSLCNANSYSLLSLASYARLFSKYSMIQVFSASIMFIQYSLQALVMQEIWRFTQEYWDNIKAKFGQNEVVSPFLGIVSSCQFHTVSSLWYKGQINECLAPFWWQLGGPLVIHKWNLADMIRKGKVLQKTLRNNVRFLPYRQNKRY